MIDYEVPVSLQHGDHATYAAHVLLLPREGWGVAVVMNLNDVTAPDEYHRLAQDVAAILLVRAPRTPASFDGALVEHAKVLLLAVFALEAWAVVRSLRTSGRRRRAAWRPSRARIALSAGVAGAIGLGIAGCAVWLVLEHADAPLALAPRLAPDIGLVLLGIVVLGVAWGPVRAALLLRAAYGRRPAV